MRDPETGWEVQEIARKWVMHPEEIRVVPVSGEVVPVSGASLRE
jgi:hypothetical protein